jgi:hypothetical protein
VYEIEYNIDNSITRLNLNGILEKSDVERLTKELYDNFSGNKILLLTDARNVIYDFNIKELHDLEDITDKFFKPEILVYEAIIIATPKETAMTAIFNRKERKNHIVKMFSTGSAALSRLLNFQ